MHKHHQNLERLCQKLQFRYGEDDGLVMQLKHELESLESRQSKSSPKASQDRRKQDKEESSIFVH